MERFTKNKADQLAQTVKFYILKSNIKGRSENYNKRRESAGARGDLLITDQYYDSIYAKRIAHNHWAVGAWGEHIADRKVAWHDDPVPMFEIFKTLEYGNPERNIKARPHWTPAIRDWKTAFRKPSGTSSARKGGGDKRQTTKRRLSRK